MMTNFSMPLAEFAELVKKNVDLFTKDYLEKRSEHPHPDSAYPVNLSQAQWFDQLKIWSYIFEIKSKEEQPVYQENELEDGGIEFLLEDIDIE